MRQLYLSLIVLGLLVPGIALAEANLVSPAPGSTLQSTSVTFTWTVGSLDSESWVYVGTFSGGKDVYDSGNLYNRTFVTVNNLPANGQSLFVRVWTRRFLIWTYRDFTYTAVGSSIRRKSEITSPAPGSTLNGSSVGFSWGGGAGVVDQRLVAGNSRGSADLFDSGWLGRVSGATAYNLPTDGRVLYVRLYSSFGFEQQWSDYVYFAQNPAKSVITNPQPGSTLAGSSPTFSWTSGSGVSDRQLWIGNYRGGADLAYRTNLGQVTSLNVSGLPTDGRRIYVTLWSLLSSGWQSAEYTYSAALGGGPVKSSMQNPPPNTTLSSTRITFTWGGGSGVLEQWLYIGSAPVVADYFNSGSLGTRTSVTASGLPDDGRRLYVTLWSRLATGWQYTVYNYDAAGYRAFARK